MRRPDRRASRIRNARNPGAFRAASGGGFLYRRADAIDDIAHLILPVALGHHTDDGFGSRRANDEAACPGQFALDLCNGALHIIMIERLAAGEADVLQKLWHRIELMQYLARAFARAHQRREYL